jgi:hypothetical protein
LVQCPRQTVNVGLRTEPLLSAKPTNRDAELRRVKRARSRKLYTFSSAVLAQIDLSRNEIRSG